MHWLKHGFVRMEKFRAEMTYIDRGCQNTINGLKNKNK